MSVTRPGRESDVAERRGSRCYTFAMVTFKTLAARPQGQGAWLWRRCLRCGNR